MFTVLGASGAIGSHVVRYLQSIGEDVFAPHRHDRTVLTRPLGHVIYAIGVTADFRTRPHDTIQAHVCALSDILKQSDFQSLIYLSSTRIYSAASSTSEDATFHVDPQNPSDLYNLSKLIGESLCYCCGRKGVKVARLSNVIGGEDWDSDNFLPSLVRAARNGTIYLRTHLTSANDYIHIDDVAALLCKILCTGRHNLYNVASGQQTTHLEWINYLISQTGCSFEVEADAPVVGCAPIDIQRLSDEFSFQPKSVFSSLPLKEPQKENNV